MRRLASLNRASRSRKASFSRMRSSDRLNSSSSMGAALSLGPRLTTSGIDAAGPTIPVRPECYTNLMQIRRYSHVHLTPAP